VAVYQSRHAAILTIVTQDRQPIFASGRWATTFTGVLRSAALAREVRVFAYCFMPDHLHLLVQSTGSHSLIGFVKEFKQRTAYQFKRASGRRLWQKSYHDHFMRDEDDLLSAAWYVFRNPVRAGIVARAEEYAHNGSLVWDRSVLVEA
jgi:putative transposase